MAGRSGRVVDLQQRERRSLSGEHQKTNTLNGRAWFFLALSGLATAISWVAYFKALSLGAATPVTAIGTSSLAVTMVLAVMFLGERASWRAGVGIILIVAGSLVASGAK